MHWYKFQRLYEFHIFAIIKNCKKSFICCFNTFFRFVRTKNDDIAINLNDDTNSSLLISFSKIIWCIHFRNHDKKFFFWFFCNFYELFIDKSIRKEFCDCQIQILFWEIWLHKRRHQYCRHRIHFENLQ